MIRGFLSFPNSLTLSRIGNVAVCEALESYLAPIERVAERLQ